MATEDLDRLTSEVKLWEECREFVAKDKSDKGGKVPNIKQPQVGQQEQRVRENVYIVARFSALVLSKSH